ncbi:MAG: glutaredoxin family protein [Desulfuromonas sp.]|nr:MAG: glutaredoxin family protein [Desulfuromonas sp.]
MMRKAVLYRMSTQEHICPFGLKSKDLLERNGFEVDDRLLSSREETDMFQEKHGVETTPQTFIDDKRVGGYEDLREYFGLGPEQPEGTSYVPVIVIFGSCLLLAVAIAGRFEGGFFPLLLESFIALAMSVLAIMKLRDLNSFSTMFITYDLLAMRKLRYANIYPFAELYAGFGMLAGITAWLVAPVALFIGSVGSVSVLKAVYIDKRELKCACVGGDSNVPLGFVSLTENLVMVFAAIWMWIR